MNGLGAVTAAVGIVALLGAVVIATVGRMQWPRLAAALVLTGVAGVLNSTIGPALQRAVTAVDRQAGQFIGRWTGTAVIGLVGVVVLAVAAFWIWQGRIDMRTLGVTALVPPTVTLIPGAVGSMAVAAVGVVPMLLGGAISWLFGIR